MIFIERRPTPCALRFSVHNSIFCRFTRGPMAGRENRWLYQVGPCRESNCQFNHHDVDGRFTPSQIKIGASEQIFEERIGNTRR
jgi:hypothetical protein